VIRHVLIHLKLLYELQLFALSDSLPLVSHYFYDVFKNASSFFRANYILGRILNGSTAPIFGSDVYSKALRYPACNQRVLEVLHTLMKDLPRNTKAIQLPRRLFRSLHAPEVGWSDKDYPLPLLRYLYDNPNIPSINTNAHDGYALTRAVHAKFTSLIQFLLEHRASPKCHNNLAVEVAIRQKNLKIVKMLVERSDCHKEKGKKRKLEDRISLDSRMLKIAVMSNAPDIVEYIHREKRVVPDVQTLKKMTS
jgi:hypothetical protein